jgi:hypothetical protein
MHDSRFAWWERRWFFALVLIGSAIPLLYPTIPPLVDLPGHMGQYRVELDDNSIPELRNFYSFHWQLIGNLAVDLLIIPMAKIFGLELGVKLIIIAIPMLAIGGIFWISREVHGKVTPIALFILPLAYNHPFNFGFVNYSLSMALALNAFALWIRLGRLKRYRTRATLFVVLSPVLWVGHVYGWATLCIFCASWELAIDLDIGGFSVRALLNAAGRCLPLTPPLLLMIIWRSGSSASSILQYSWLDKLQWWIMVFRDRWASYDAISAILLIVLFVGLVGTKFIALTRSLILIAIILSILYVIMPSVVFGLAYADMRLTPYIIIFGFLALTVEEPVSKTMRYAIATTGCAFFLIRMTGATLSFAQSADAFDDDLAVLQHVPDYARLAGFVGHTCRSGWNPDMFDHLPSMAIVRKRAFTNDQWGIGSGQLMRPIYPGGDEAARRYRGDPDQIVTAQRCGSIWSLDTALKELPRDKFDYVWLINPPPFDINNIGGMKRVWENESSALYLIDRRP